MAEIEMAEVVEMEEVDQGKDLEKEESSSQSKLPSVVEGDDAEEMPPCYERNCPRLVAVARRFSARCVLTLTRPVWSKVSIAFWVVSIIYCSFEYVTHLDIDVNDILEGLALWAAFFPTCCLFVPSGCGMIYSNPWYYPLIGFFLYAIPAGYPTYSFATNTIDDFEDFEASKIVNLLYYTIGWATVVGTCAAFLVNIIYGLTNHESDTDKERKEYMKWGTKQISSILLYYQIKDKDTDESTGSDGSKKEAPGVIVCACGKGFPSSLPFSVHLCEDHRLPEGSLINRSLSTFTSKGKGGKKGKGGEEEEEPVSIVGACLNLVYPLPKISKPLQKAPVVYPYSLHVGVLYGAILGGIVIFALVVAAKNLRESFQDKVDNLHEAADELRTSDGLGDHLADRLEDLADFLDELGTALYVSMFVGVGCGGIITCFHFPLIYLGWRKMVLETRYGIQPRPKFSEVGLWSKSLIVGNFVSSLVMELVFIFLIVGLAVFFLAFEPLRDWLLSLWEIYVSIAISVVFVAIMKLLYDIFFLDGNTPRHVGGIGFTDLPFIGASVPYSTLASFMRLVYVLLYMFLALPRFDETLLPEGIRTFDTAWTSFHSLHRFQLCGCQLVEIAAEAFMDGIGNDLPDEPTTKKFRRVRNRWWLFSILALNPTLTQYRSKPKAAISKEM